MGIILFKEGIKGSSTHSGKASQPQRKDHYTNHHQKKIAN